MGRHKQECVLELPPDADGPRTGSHGLSASGQTEPIAAPGWDGGLRGGGHGATSIPPAAPALFLLQQGVQWSLSPFTHMKLMMGSGPAQVSASGYQPCARP